MARPRPTVVARLTARFGGRGGGNRELAQAGGLSDSGQVVVDAARRVLEETGPEPSREPEAGSR